MKKLYKFSLVLVLSAASTACVTHEIESDFQDRPVLTRQDMQECKVNDYTGFGQDAESKAALWQCYRNLYEGGTRIR